MFSFFPCTGFNHLTSVLNINQIKLYVAIQQITSWTCRTAKICLVVVCVESRPTNKQLSFSFSFLICRNLNFKKDFYQIKHFLLFELLSQVWGWWHHNGTFLYKCLGDSVLPAPTAARNILSPSHWVRESELIIHSRDLKGSRQFTI